MNEELEKEWKEIEEQIDSLSRKKDEIYKEMHKNVINNNLEFFKNLEGKSFWSIKHPEHIYLCVKSKGYIDDGLGMYEITCHELFNDKDVTDNSYVYYKVNDIRFYHEDDFRRNYEIGEKIKFIDRISNVFNNILSNLGM